MVSNHTYLKMRASSECLLHVCHPEIVVPHSVLSMDFFLYINGLLFSDAIDEGLLLLLPLPPLLLSRRPGFSRFVEATVSRCMLEGLTFVSTLFESCEPYSLLSTVGLEKIRSTYYRSSLPSCAILNRNFTIHVLSKFIW